MFRPSVGGYIPFVSPCFRSSCAQFHRSCHWLLPFTLNKKRKEKKKDEEEGKREKQNKTKQNPLTLTTWFWNVSSASLSFPPTHPAIVITTFYSISLPTPSLHYQAKVNPSPFYYFASVLLLVGYRNKRVETMGERSLRKRQRRRKERVRL